MTDIPPTATGMTPPTNAKYNRAQAFRAIGFSIVVNAVLPYLIYRFLEPKFPSGSLMPLLASTVFPLFGLGFGAMRRKTVDYIAVISLVEIAISIVVTLVAADVRLALVARALQGTLTGLFFLATIPLGRPLMFYIARQFVAASTPEVMANFDRAHELDGGATFRRLTAVWGVGTILVSLANLALAATVAPANYLLFAPILGIGSNVVMIWWTIRYSTARFTRYYRPA